MDLALSLPLYALLVVQTLVALLLLCPRVVSRHIAQAITKGKANKITTTVIYTMIGALLVLSVLTFYDVNQNVQISKQNSGSGGLVASLDLQRGLVGLLLSSFNLLLLLLLPALAVEQTQCDRGLRDKEVMLKQVKGLQAEYNRVTSAAPAPAREVSSPAGNGAELAALQRELEALRADKERLKAAADEAAAAQRSAEARVEAIRTQARGLEKEYDRLLSEKDELERRLQRAGGLEGRKDR